MVWVRIFLGNILIGILFRLIAINEFSSMLFLRTRTSLYFLPKFIILINVMFLYYFQSTGINILINKYMDIII